MSQKNARERILWVERAQVAGMLLVVLHHCMPHGYAGPRWLANLLEAIQYPALAVFFFTSGCFALRWRRDGWAAYLKKRALRLLVPYLCVNLLMLLPRYAVARLMGKQAYITAGWLLMSFLDPHGQGITPHLWFLPSLFIMAALLPLIDALTRRSRLLRRATVAALLILSALPVNVTTLLCLNEIRLYLAFFVLGYAMASERGAEYPLRGAARPALGVAGLIAFAASLGFAASPFAPFVQRVGGGLALLSLAGISESDDPVTAAFRGKTYVIYILSMCVQNLVEAAGYSAGLPWYVTSLAMLIFGLAVPCALWAWNQKRPLPRLIQLITGL